MSENPHFRMNEGTFEIPRAPIDRHNPTSVHLAEIINQEGRVPFSQFMNACLYGPDGYYSRGKAQIGFDLEGRHFITSPEISPFFGASLGSASKQVWEAMGKPADFQIVEQGPGNGTMAADLLGWAENEAASSEGIRQFYDALTYPIIEYGDLIAAQQRRINNDKVSWVRDSAINFPLEVNGVILSNELPDTFPVEAVRRFQVSGRLTGILQQFVSIEDNRWLEVWDKPTEEVTDYIHSHNLEVLDQETPVNLEALRWQRAMDRSLQSGAIITIDYSENTYGRIRVYGADRRPYNREAIYRNPGEADITSDVNFPALRAQAEADGLRTAFFGSESEFLQKAGIDHLTHDIAEKIRDSRSLSETLELSEKLGGVRFLLHHPSQQSYYAQVLTKNIQLELNGDTIHPSDKPRYKLEIGQPNKAVTIGNITVSSDEYEQLWLDPVEVPPHELFMRKVTIDGRRQRLDDLIGIFQDSAYHFDLDGLENL